MACITDTKTIKTVIEFFKKFDGVKIEKTSDTLKILDNGIVVYQSLRKSKSAWITRTINTSRFKWMDNYGSKSQSRNIPYFANLNQGQTPISIGFGPGTDLRSEPGEPGLPNS